MYTLFIMIYYTLCIHYTMYSLYEHTFINYFERSKILTFLLILHHFATNLGKNNVDEEKYCNGDRRWQK